MCIQFDKVSYTYGTGRLPKYIGLNSVDLHIEQGRFIAVLGEPGSGKSTLLQHFNGILKPTEGRLRVLDFDIAPGSGLKRAKQLRKQVGLVFQFPEQQLFEETIEKDLIFGPKNYGASEEEAREAARRAIGLLGLPESILRQNPFRLSGGQMRKAAIAAVLAIDPDIFVLDEPTASLDPASREELMRLLHELCHERKKTIIVVTHRLEEVLPYADELVVMRRGEVAFHGPIGALLNKKGLLEESGLVVPPSVRLLQRFSEHYEVNFPESSFSVEEIADFMIRVMTDRSGSRSIAEEEALCETG
jgi:energy-coupling factor transport system ATP-binding protein